MFSLRSNGLLLRSALKDVGFFSLYFVRILIMGRARLSEEDKRKTQVNIRLTDSELRMITAYAQSAGITPANWIRKKVFTGRFPPVKISPIDAAVYQELHKIGVNLNQAVKQVYNGRQGEVPINILTTLLELQKEIIKRLVS